MKKYLLVGLFLGVASCLLAAGNTVMEAGDPYNDGGNNAKFDGQVTYQTDKYIVCDVFTSTGINDCIDLLGSEGGEVYLPEGTYTITTAIVIDVASTTITGAGAGTILDASAGFESPAPVAIIDTNDKDYVIIQNLTIIGNAGDGDFTSLIGDDDEADYLIVQNCILKNSDWRAIFTNGDYILIHNNTFINNDASTIEVKSLYGVISNNLIVSGVSHGINVHSESAYVIVQNNIIRNVATFGIYNVGADYCNISNNIIDNNTNNAIVLLANADYNIISDNIITDSGGSAADIKISADFCVITNNNLYGSGATNQGIWLDEADECTVTGNYTDNHDVAGIQEDSDCQNNLIYGNNIQDSTPYIINGTLPETFFTNGPFELVFVDTGTTPSSAGLLGRTAQYVVYVSTATDDAASWQKLSTQ